jgi:hypothetical protein
MAATAVENKGKGAGSRTCIRTSTFRSRNRFHGRRARRAGKFNKNRKSVGRRCPTRTQFRAATRHAHTRAHTRAHRVQVCLCVCVCACLGGTHALMVTRKSIAHNSRLDARPGDHQLFLSYLASPSLSGLYYCALMRALASLKPPIIPVAYVHVHVAGNVSLSAAMRTNDASAAIQIFGIT